MKSWYPIPTLLMTATLACSGASGEDQPVVLDQPETTLPGTYSQVSSVVELRDGRVAFADLRDKHFLYGSFSPARVDTIGTRVDTILVGDPAPGRYKYPGLTLRLPGDTVALVDFAAERTMLWNEKGEFLAVLRLQPVAGTNQPLWYDSLGYAYKADYRAIMGGLEPGKAVRVDSAPVLRYPRKGTLADTVARLKLPEMGQGQFGETVKQVATIFSGSDAFGVTPDGALWVARSRTNSVDWRSPGGEWVKGAPRPYKKVTVTQADRDHFMEMAHQNGLPAGLEIRFPFADHKPPFTGALGGLDGRVWLQRSRAADDPVAVYDVIGRDGRLVQSVQLPKGAMLGGVGTHGALYLLLKGADDRVTLARFRLEEK